MKYTNCSFSTSVSIANTVLFFIVALGLSSCGNTVAESNEKSRLENLLEITVYLDEDLATIFNRSETLPINVNNEELPRFVAIFNVDGGDDQVMQVTSLAAKMTLPKLKFDVHEFAFRFLYALDENPDNNILLADANITTKDRKINIQANELTISSLSFDDDGDGAINLKEIVLGTNPKNAAPTIVSADSVTVLENSTTVLTVSAIAPNPDTVLTYTISGGLDQALFTLDPTTGALEFVQAPNYQAPADSNVDNIYQVQVAVSDGNLSYFQDVLITITDVFDLKYSIGVKQINFSWVAYEGATLYKIFEGKDCLTITPSDNEVYAGSKNFYDFEIAVHQYPPTACFYLQVFDANQSMLALAPTLKVNLRNVVGEIIGIDYKRDYLPVGVSYKFNPLSISDDGSTFVVGLPGFGLLTGAVNLYKRVGTGSWVLKKQFGVDQISTLVMGDRFGVSVSISGDGNTLAVGAVGVDFNATLIDSGAIYIFRWDNTAGSSGEGDWVLQPSELAIAPASNNHFGLGLGLNVNGNSLVAQARSGVFVFSWFNNRWILDKNLDSFLSASQLANFGTGGYFSGAISISDDGRTIAAGKNGGVFVFNKPSDTTLSSWYLESQMIPNPDNLTSGGQVTTSRFGEIISISGDGNVVAVGDYGVDYKGLFDHTDVGMIYVYRINENGAWVLWSEFIPYHFYELGYNSNMNFGRCVSLSKDGGLIATGSPGGTDYFPEGETSIYTWFGDISSSKSMMGDWQYAGGLYPNNAGENDAAVLDYGCSSKLSSDGSTLLVEAQRVVNGATSIATDLYIY